MNNKKKSMYNKNIVYPNIKIEITEVFIPFKEGGNKLLPDEIIYVAYTHYNDNLYYQQYYHQSQNNINHNIIINDLKNKLIFSIK